MAQVDRPTIDDLAIVDNPEFFVASNRWVNMRRAHMHPFTDVKCALRTTERGVFI